MQQRVPFRLVMWPGTTSVLSQAQPEGQGARGAWGAQASLAFSEHEFSSVHAQGFLRLLEYLEVCPSLTSSPLDVFVYSLSLVIPATGDESLL